MPEPQPIYVNGRLFLGRVEEQKQFRAALLDTLPPPPGEDLPYVILLYGDGGIGKTTLAQRYKDIVEKEPPFEGSFFTLWIDWEEERSKHSALQIGREQISVETVFDRIHANIIKADDKWGRHFSRYQKMVAERAEIEKQAAEILTGGAAEDEFSRKLVGASTTVLAKIIRWRLPLGDTGENLAQQFLEAGVDIGAEQAANLLNFMKAKLQARLKPEQYQVYLEPLEQLALALAEGLKQITRQKPLVFFFDTYEIIDRTDIWIRDLVKAAGPKLMWVIAGRNNLVTNRQFGQENFKGYADTFPRRLLAYDVHQLARADVAAYFAEIALPHVISEEEVDALTRATRGIPLAMRIAGEIWSRGVGIAEIVGDLDSNIPHQEIVEQMTARYLLHVMKKETDRQAIYALALAKGNLKVLQAMLEGEIDSLSFDLPAYLQKLRRDYAAIHSQEARLHDEPAAYILSHLQQEEWRSSWNIQRLNQNAEAALRKQIKQLETEILLLEERVEDEDWLQATLELTQTLFWLDEQAGWQYFVPRFVEGLAYNLDLVGGLLESGKQWKNCLSKRGQKRLKIFSQAAPLQRNIENAAEMVKELNHLSQLGWLQGEFEQERKAILSWLNGLVYFRQKKLDNAQQAFAEAERGLPAEGVSLAQHLGEALDDLASQMLWPDGRSEAVFAPEAEKLLQKVTWWLPEKAGAWNRLGSAYLLGKKFAQALKAFNQAIQLNLEDDDAFNNRGTAYADLGKFDEALADFNRAIQLNPEDATAFYNRGSTYYDLGKFDEALADFNRAIQLNPEYATAFNNRGNTYKALNKFDEALADFNQAIQLNPKYAIAYSSLAACYRKVGNKTAYEIAVANAKPLIIKERNYNQACFAAICGDLEEAITLLKVALEESPRDRQLVQTDPDFDFIRDDPRFMAFLQELA